MNLVQCNSCEHAREHLSAADPKPSRPLTVLVVDDDADFLLQQRLRLEAAGFHVLAAEGPAEAERLAAEERCDAAVLDLMMDDPDSGFTLSYRLKKRSPRLPVIMVSSVNNETGLGFGLASDAERSWIKADAFLAKPIRFEQLIAEIHRLVRA